MARLDVGQLDVELKYSFSTYEVEDDCQMTKLQWLKMKEMNEHGMPAVCLVYSEPLDLFFVTTLLRDTLPGSERRVMKLPGDEVIRGTDLFTVAMGYLNGLE